MTVKEMAEWLAAAGYPYDFSFADTPLPEPLRVPLAEAWLALDGDEGMTPADYLVTMQMEGAW